MSYDSIRISRERDGFQVCATDPEIVEQNRKRDKGSGDCCSPSGSWRDPNVEYKFETKEQVIDFITKAIDIALPADEYSSAFDKLAKEAIKA